MVNLVGRYANPMDPMVKLSSCYPAENNAFPMTRARISLSKDGDVIEPQKRCEESWLVAMTPSLFLLVNGKNLRSLVDWEV